MSFKRKNLSGANFSGADIRGTNFTQAKLKGTNFSKVKTGLQLHWKLILIGFSLVLSAIAAFGSAFSGIIAVDFLVFTVKSNEYTVGASLISLVLVGVFLIVTHFQNLVWALGVSAVVGATTIAITAVLDMINGIIAGAVAGVFTAVTIALSFVLAISLNLIIILTKPTAAVLTLVTYMAGTVAGCKVGLDVNTAQPIVQPKDSYIAVSVYLALVGTLLGGYNTRLALSEDNRFVLFVRLLLPLLLSEAPASWVLI
ncbi:MAG: pentapeptide repeat-containing protein [Moorea sp. SIO4E2]|uniref:Low-complexity protein n=1 Tax=Moorena producens 3L TaxID=489825 RepID=F4XW77_9CYAN|nr:hypothetical protein LYNGBM3L_42820 [Moorena producens 3L]NEP67929.1 pentapeptide repeat-containing protein [Moorena sp. SIO3A5]NEQ09295.1 pentapeptide repeat-containing protein [Moorena sp. SIO4E2]OLT65824.1 hypothetical protein BI334_12970 [Moorena producens 3L]